mgnify:CR=1 FL=1
MLIIQHLLEIVPGMTMAKRIDSSVERVTWCRVTDNHEGLAACGWKEDRLRADGWNVSMRDAMERSERGFIRSRPVDRIDNEHE